MDNLDLTPENETEEKTASAPRRRAKRDFSFSSFQEEADTITFEAVDEEAEEKKEDPSFEEETESEGAEESLASEETDENKDKKEEVTLDELYNKEPPAEEQPDEEPLSGAGNLFDWLKSFLLSLTAVIFIFTLIFRGVTVSGDSMLPTLEDREYLIISDLLYEPKTGDIVVVQSPNYKGGTEPLIKRVIATGGQTLKINFQTWQVWVDGVELQEDYIAFEEGLNMNPEDLNVNENNEAELVVEENCVFVMGDHRNDSLDSRSEAVGQIDQRYIMGRVMLRVTPFSKFGKVK
ncbi:MAG: signal peptidase I [Clostridia bacterium]|nr:signal peptidase I [Clostridia bacterium]